VQFEEMEGIGFLSGLLPMRVGHNQINSLSAFGGKTIVRTSSYEARFLKGGSPTTFMKIPGADYELRGVRRWAHFGRHGFVL
jgi:hypothetical protein